MYIITKYQMYEAKIHRTKGEMEISTMMVEDFNMPFLLKNTIINQVEDKLKKKIKRTCLTTQ